MLDCCYFVDGNEVLYYHIDKFEFSHDWSVLLLELFSLLDHEFLDVVIAFVGSFEFIVDFCQLFASMLYLLFES